MAFRVGKLHDVEVETGLDGEKVITKLIKVVEE
jgi:hypothetical protein